MRVPFKKGRPPRKNKKGCLRAAFAAAIGGLAVTASIFAGAGAANDTPDQINTVFDKGDIVAPAEPSVIDAFGQRAAKAPWTKDEDYYLDQWSGMLERQRKGLEDPAKLAAYKKFLSQFDFLKGKSLAEQAEGVNHIVNVDTDYVTDQEQYGVNDYWAAPIETVLSHKGDCEDRAILEEAALRYLHVPESRLFIALVNSRGNPAVGLDHAILLLNVAPVGAPPNFLILSDMEPAIPADNLVIGKTWYFGSLKGFALYNVRNENGYWKVTPAKTLFAAGSSAGTAAKSAPGMG